jgi:uncharacterized membrane protein YbhN (UPF0104 family)
VALVVNLLTLVAKGWAWQVMVNTAARCRWWVAQVANLVGSAVNSISVVFVGEGARIRYLRAHDQVPAAVGVASVVWSRVVEGVAFVILFVVAPFFFPLPSLFRALHLAASIALIALGALYLARRWPPLIALGRRVATWMPGGARQAAGKLFSIRLTGGALGWPLLLSVVNWFGQWLTYHLVYVASGRPVPFAASFLALVASNAGLLLRLTPGNVGVMQGAMALVLLPFGISADRAVVAGLVLQAVQVLPVLVLALLFTGGHGLRRRGGAGPPE